LIPTNTGFNSFVPTRPSPIGNPGFVQSQPTGFNPSYNLPPSGLSIQVQPTGYNPQPSPLYHTPLSTMSSGFSTVSSLNPPSNFTTPSNFTSPSPLYSQPTGYNGASYGGQFGGNPNPANNAGNNFVNSLQNSASPFNPPNTSPPPENHNPANIFASMKAGAFANDAAPQTSDKYDALRPQPTGWNGLQGLGPQAGFQPQPTGFQSPQPGMGTGFNAFGQPLQPGFGQPQGYQTTGYGNYQS